MSAVEERVDLLAELGRADAERRLLRAIRCPRSCQGLYGALVQVELALEDYLQASSLPRVALWLQVCQGLIERCEQLLEAGHLGLTLSPAGEHSAAFAVLSQPPRGGLDDEARRCARMLLAILILAACSRYEPVDAPAMGGWATLQRFDPQRAGMPADWRRIAVSVPTTAEELEQALADAITPGLQDLLAGALSAIRRPISEPERGARSVPLAGSGLGRADKPERAVPPDASGTADSDDPIGGSARGQEEALGSLADQGDGYGDADACEALDEGDGSEEDPGQPVGDDFGEVEGPAGGGDGPGDPDESRRGERASERATEHAHGSPGDARQQADVRSPQAATRARRAGQRNSSTPRGPRDEAPARDNPIGWLIKSDNQARHARRFDLIGSYDRLHPRSTQQVWHKLITTWRDGGPEDRIRVLVAHLSQRSALPARLALQLRLDTTQSVAVDVDDGSVVWDYRAALDSASEATRSARGAPVDSHAIRLPLDADMAQALRVFRQLRPEAETVVQLLGLPGLQAACASWLSGYREFLRQHGDRQHPPYDARFARSLADVYRDTGASEILVLMGGLDFAAMPLGMLHYVALPAALLAEADQRVFAALGWRWPAQRPVSTQSWIGAASVLDPASIQAGWSRLQERTRRAQTDLRACGDAASLVEAFNRLAASRLMGFLTVVGHRGSRLSRLTRRALLSAGPYLHLFDKAVGDYQSDRLVPAHAWVDQLLAAWQDDVALLVQRAQDLGVSLLQRGRRALLDTRPQAGVFFGVRLGASQGRPQLERTLVWRRSLTQEAQTCWGRSLNLGRHWLVSQLLQRGVSSWEVRVLTGHHRQFAEVFSDGMNRSPQQALQQLRLDLENLFQDLKLEPPAGLSSRKRSRTLMTPAGELPRPSSDRYLRASFSNAWRVLPPPFDAWTTTALSVVHRLRASLCEGRDLPLANAEFTAAQTLFGWLDPQDQAAIFDTLPRSVSRVKATAVMVWRRPDRQQELCMRMSDRSVLALARLGLRPAGTWRASAEACARWARARLPELNWPDDDHQAYLVLAALAARVRRLEGSPAVLTAAHAGVHSASFSMRSIWRIAGERGEVPETATLGRVVRRGASRSTREGAGPLFDLAHAVRSVSYVTLPLGEEQQRARDWQAALAELDLQDDLRAQAWKDVQLEEIRLLLTHDKDRDETTTLAGHAREVLLTLNLLQPWDDPRQMEPEQFRELVPAAMQAIDHDKLETQPVRWQQTRWFGLKRFLKIGRRLGWRIPGSLFENPGHRAGLEAMRRSAASVALLREDFAPMHRLLREHFAAWPIDQRRAELALTLLHDHPLRSSEQTVLPVDALVHASDTLIIENGGFSHLKSSHAGRHLVCAPGLLALLRQAEVDPARPSGRYLFVSDDGRDWSLARAIDEAVVSAAAQVTGEAAVRKHSFRGSAACRLLWPDWQDLAQGLLDGAWSVQRCRMRNDDDARRPPTVIQAAARSVGHGLPLVTLAYYGAAWPFLVTAGVQAGLAAFQPGSPLLDQALGSRQTWDRARRRCKASGQDFDPWGSAAAQCVQALDLPPLLVPDESTVLRPRHDDPWSVEPDTLIQVRCLALLMAGDHPEACADRLGIPYPHALRLRSMLPDPEELDLITRRLGGRARPSTLADDRALMESPIGQALWDSLLKAPRTDVRLLLASLSPRRLNVRERPPTPVQLVRRVQTLLRCLPPDLGLQIRFSAAYPPILTPDLMLVCGDRLVQGRPHPSIGRHPRFQVVAPDQPRAPRLTGRLTVVVRMMCEATVILFTQRDEAATARRERALLTDNHDIHNTRELAHETL